MKLEKSFNLIFHNIETIEKLKALYDYSLPPIFGGNS